MQGTITNCNTRKNVFSNSWWNFVSTKYISKGFTIAECILWNMLYFLT